MENIVVVKNIPIEWDEFQVFRVFKLAGIVYDVRLPKVSPHFSTRYGFITFRLPSEARLAISKFHRMSEVSELNLKVDPPFAVNIFSESRACRRLNHSSVVDKIEDEQFLSMFDENENENISRDSDEQECLPFFSPKQASKDFSELCTSVEDIKLNEEKSKGPLTSSPNAKSCSEGRFLESRNLVVYDEEFLFDHSKSNEVYKDEFGDKMKNEPLTKPISNDLGLDESKENVENIGSKVQAAMESASWEEADKVKLTTRCAVCRKICKFGCVCKEIFYCDRKCQAKDWPSHKVDCTFMKNKTEVKTA